ncbi:MAG: hypothetical protein RML72_02975 [Bacteroidia bacterium]|nr:hypothetical protein [Bacteroidia bacterium]MDW8157824.1 hypothetical protein [Bacteroidia bacterium]
MANTTLANNPQNSKLSKQVIGIYQDAILKALAYHNIECEVRESLQESKIIAKVESLQNTKITIEFIFERGQYVFYAPSDILDIFVHVSHFSRGGYKFPSTLSDLLSLISCTYDEICNVPAVFYKQSWKERVLNRKFKHIREQEEELYELETEKIELQKQLNKESGLYERILQKVKSKEKVLLRKIRNIQKQREQMDQEVIGRVGQALLIKEREVSVFEAAQEYRKQNFSREVKEKLDQQIESVIALGKKEIEEKGQLVEQKKKEYEEKLAQKEEVVKQEQLTVEVKENLLASREAAIGNREKFMSEEVAQRIAHEYIEKLTSRKRAIELRKQTLLIKERVIEQEFQAVKSEYECFEREVLAQISPRLNKIIQKQKRLEKWRQHLEERKKIIDEIKRRRLQKGYKKDKL